MPKIVVIAGPNGAGKSTTAPRLLRSALSVNEFVNADTIAAGLSAFAPETVAMAAGRAMLARIKILAATRADFAFETTLASRTFAPWLRGLQQSGYTVHVIYLWLNNVDLAVARVGERVRHGGHAVPEPTVRRRYERSLFNFFNLYRPFADSWLMLDNSHSSVPRTIAWRNRGGPLQIVTSGPWFNLSRNYEQNILNQSGN